MDWRERIEPDGNRVLLSFSCGKDSLASWVLLRREGFDVVPFYMMHVPDLEFVERSLRYYERFFGVHIYRVLHPSLYRWLNTRVATPPCRNEAINFLRLPNYGYEDVEDGMRRTAGIECGWVAVGSKRSDSIARRMRVPACGYIERTRKFFPMVNANKADVIEILRSEGVKLPVDYEAFGRSFDGIDYQYLHVIKERWPEDYATILRWFPMHAQELFRERVAAKHGQDAKAGGKGQRAARSEGVLQEVGVAPEEEPA